MVDVADGSRATPKELEATSSGQLLITSGATPAHLRPNDRLRQGDVSRSLGELKGPPGRMPRRHALRQVSPN
jgi:hypothetical protein